ncbi:MAG: type III-A CRISPR-associated CARF protein Csm6 [Saccharofermentanales bacterium]
MSRILFSCIGMSDPIRGDFDGPFLHMIRQYKPHKVYFFLTTEVREYHQRDNRYVILAKRVSPDSEIIALDEFTDLQNPSDFNSAYENIKPAMNYVAGIHPEDEIYLNISSGTPQMISTLYLLAAVSRKALKCIKVSTPDKRSNKSEPVGLDFNIEASWASDLDNISDSEIENRCIEVETLSVRKEIAVEELKAHISNYDYYSALMIAEENSDFIPASTIGLLRAGKLRYDLFYGDAKTLARKHGYEFCVNEIDQEVRDVFEYYLRLKLKAEREEILDFAIGVSPLLKSISISYLAKKFNILSCCSTGKIRKLLRSRIPNNLLKFYDEYFEHEFRDSFLTFSNVFPAIKYYFKDSDNDSFLKFYNLKEFEEKIRNESAHEIQSLDSKTLKNNNGYSANEILRQMRALIISAYGSLDQFEWDAYGRLNEAILRSVGR